MAEITKNVDLLGFDKFNIANIKRAYSANKMTYRKMDTLAAKIRKMHDEYMALQGETEAFEGAVKVITNKVLGIDLTSREALAYHENPVLFAKNYPTHELSASIREAFPEAFGSDDENPEEVKGVMNPSLDEGTDTCEDAPAEVEAANPFNM